MTLKEHLAELIRLDGPQRISSLMELALAHPREGYYAARPAIGGDGDFITAPEISQTFGEMIGAFAFQTWIDMGEPDAWSLIELGPGRGTLMLDMLRTLRLRPRALDGLEIVLIEASPTLAQEQRRRLAGTGIRTEWLREISYLPERPLVLVANEFFDALPIRQFWRQHGRWFERRVCLKDPDAPAFEFVLLPSAAPLGLLDAEPAESRILEASLVARNYAHLIGEHLAHAPGRALILDYGYSGEGNGDTLQALAGHKKADVLEALGAADLSAHVDFGALARTAREAGARVDGPVAQGAFLERLGIGARFAALTERASADERAVLKRQHHRLTAPGEMGELFKVLALSSPTLVPPPGFSDG